MDYVRGSRGRCIKPGTIKAGKGTSLKAHQKLVKARQHMSTSVPLTFLFELTQYKRDCFVTRTLRDRTGSLTSGYEAQRHVWEDVNRCHRSHVLKGVTQWAPTVHAANTSSHKSVWYRGEGGSWRKAALPHLAPKQKPQPLPKKFLSVPNP